MGIRFYCPNGHKLNVKEFQAGRLGICPFCGARSQIPMQSTRPSTKSTSRRGASPADTRTADEDDLEAAQASDSSPDILPGEPPSRPGDPGYPLAGGGTMLGPSRPLGATSGSDPIVAPPTRSTSAAHAAAANLRSAPMKQPSPQPGQAGRIDLQVRSVPGQPAQVQPAPIAPGPVAAPSAPSPPAQPAAAPETGPTSGSPLSEIGETGPDPIAEAPDMIWYVRPPSGGQFGPATGDLMRTWLSEGRVSAESLVWREGWRDWQEAGAVFAKLRSNQIVDFLETAPVPVIRNTGVVAASASHTHRPKTSVKRSSDRNQIAILIGLSVLVMVLIAVLIWIVTHP